MDFIEGLLQQWGRDPLIINCGEDVILIIINRLNMHNLHLLNHLYTTHTITKLFFHKIFHLHGIYLVLLCDRDQAFRSNLWQELFHSKEHLILVLHFTPPTKEMSKTKTVLKQTVSLMFHK